MKCQLASNRTFGNPLTFDQKLFARLWDATFTGKSSQQVHGFATDGQGFFRLDCFGNDGPCIRQSIRISPQGIREFGIARQVTAFADQSPQLCHPADHIRRIGQNVLFHLRPVQTNLCCGGRSRFGIDLQELGESGFGIDVLLLFKEGGCFLEQAFFGVPLIDVPEDACQQKTEQCHTGQ